MTLRRGLWMGMGVFVCLGGLGAGARAQRVASNPTADASLAAVLQQPVTLRVANVTLEAAIKDLAANAGVRITYRVDQVRARTTPVSVHIQNVPLGNAFAQVLRGTGLIVEPVTAGIVNVRVFDVASVPVTQGSISGKAVDGKTRQSLRGATVSISGTNKETTTSDDGSFRFSGVVPGSYTLQIRMLGYVKATKTVTVAEGQATSVEIALDPSVNALDQVVVTGTVIPMERKAVPNAMTVVTAQDIERRGITRIDQLFRGDIPGLFAANIGANATLDSVAMSSRGATGLTGNAGNTTEGAIRQTIKTYVDGVEMANSSYLSQIDPRSIERIEILTGPQASTIYGSNAINGVMQIFTKRGATVRPNITVNMQSGLVENNFRSSLTPQHDYSAQMDGLEGRLGYDIGGSWQYIGPWTPSKQTARWSGYGSARRQVGPFTGTLSARRGLTINHGTGSRAATDIELKESGWAAPNLSTTNDGVTTSRLHGETFGLTLGYAATSWWSHELVLGTDASNTEAIRTTAVYSAFRDSLLLVTQNRQSRASQRYTTTVQVPLASIARMTVTVGADHWRTASSSMSAAPLTLTGTLANPSMTRLPPDKNTGGFLQGQLGVADALFFTYGIRGEWNPNYGAEAQPNLTPRFGMAYTRDIETALGSVTAKVRASYGRSTRPPLVGQKLAQSALEYYSGSTGAEVLMLYGPVDIQLANPDLEPEVQQGGEGGLELYFGSRGALVVTRYNQTVDHLITAPFGSDSVRSLLPNPPSGWYFGELDAEGYGYQSQQQYLNIGSIRNQGWELQGNLNTGPFTTRGTYSWAKSRVIGIAQRYRSKLTASIYQPGATFNYVPEHTWALSTTYAAGGTTLSVDVNGTGLLYRSGGELSYLTSFPRLYANKVRTALPSGYRYVSTAYAMTNLNASHRFSQTIEGVMQVQNLTNVYQNDYSMAYAAIGRQSKIGVRIRLN